ncbi:MAG: site-specific DNA-methyltransferase [Chloracidobacterium sp.]|nr:site-specific DNA-methyltransferase [Chloracidobacterium sp.]
MKETYGTEVNGWRNRIYWGDNLQVMSHLLKEFRGKVNLIYIDPPFDSKADYKKKIELRGQAISNDQNAFEEKQYTDIWTNDEYLQFMYERLVLLRELLADDGSIFVHCDWHKNHFLRIILDEVFGSESFRNEITWHYYNKMQGNINRFASNHDTILFYSKATKFTFNKIQEKRDATTKQIKRVWDKASKKLVNAKGDDGKVIYIETDDKTVDDVWRLSMLQPADRTENLFYPTQKPESVVERIIEAASNPGDLVFDCFMGSGTAQAVSMRLGRKFIGADINLGALQTTTKRLISLADELSQELEVTDEPIFKGFEVYNVNHYDVFRNPAQAKELLLESLEIQPLPVSLVWDGEKDGRLVKIMPVNRLATRADLNELIANFDYKSAEQKQNENPNKVVEKILLVCMGHEPDLAAQLKLALAPFKVDVEVVDILRDRSKLEFKRDSEAKISATETELVIEKFYPMNLLQKLSLFKENVEDWRELVESVMIDFNYDGAIFQPTMLDIPEKKELVTGKYEIPADAGNIRVKITDLLSESLEVDA